MTIGRSGKALNTFYQEIRVVGVDLIDAGGQPNDAAGGGRTKSPLEFVERGNIHCYRRSLEHCRRRRKGHDLKDPENDAKCNPVKARSCGYDCPPEMREPPAFRMIRPPIRRQDTIVGLQFYDGR